MLKNIIWKLVETPWIYSLSQAIVAPGLDKMLKIQFQHWIVQLPNAKRILDVGCGPSSRLWLLGLRPVGLDVSLACSEKFRSRGEVAVAALADAIPFSNGSFDGIWSIGLLHHLTNDIARQCILEMMRLCSSSGYIVILDSVLPEPAWRQPVATMLRRLDKGRFVRRQKDLQSLLPDREKWFCQKVVYSFNGLEAMYCIYQKNPSKNLERYSRKCCA